jgi:hypothetical protein
MQPQKPLNSSDVRDAQDALNSSEAQESSPARLSKANNEEKKKKFGQYITKKEQVDPKKQKDESTMVVGSTKDSLFDLASQVHKKEKKDQPLDTGVFSSLNKGDDEKLAVELEAAMKKELEKLLAKGVDTHEEGQLLATIKEKALEAAQQDKGLLLQEIDTQRAKKETEKTESLSKDMEQQASLLAMTSSSIQAQAGAVQAMHASDEVLLQRKQTEDRIAVVQLVQRLVDSLQQIIQEGKTETTIVLKQPPAFEGAVVVISEFRGKEFNLAFYNISNPTALRLVEEASSQASLRDAVKEKGFTLHMITIEGERRDREEDQGSLGQGKKQKQSPEQ